MKLESTENTVHNFLNDMGALLDNADGSNSGLAMVNNQFEDVHIDLMGVAAEAANVERQ